MLGERFWSKVKENPDTGCWEWTASTGFYGYGQYSHKSHPTRAHRLAYMEMVGEIPDGLHLDHLCRNRCCVNPDHLDPVPQLVNMRRAMTTHCKNGHLRSEHSRHRPNGSRYCGTCQTHRVEAPKTGPYHTPREAIEDILANLVTGRGGNTAALAEKWGLSARTVWGIGDRGATL